MAKLFDRDNEREQIQEIFDPEQSKQPFIVWIEGIEGSGKTEFMRYIINKTQLSVFEPTDFDSICKCEKINMQNEFSYISGIVFKIMKDYPTEFQEFLQDYFSDQNRITILDAGCLILPQLKLFTPIKKLLESKYNMISNSQAKITDKLTNMQLSDFFSDVIIYYLNNITLNNMHTVFCIDDAQWIDLSSTKTIHSLLGKTFRNHYDYNISFLITIRDKKQLSDDEKRNYISIYRLFEPYYEKIYTIIMSNFDLLVTQQLIESKKRYFLEKNIQQIYQITKGNPQELIQTLRMPDQEINRILKNNTAVSQCLDDNYVSQEMIVCLYKESEYFAVVLNILSVLSCSIPLKFIHSMVNEIYKRNKNSVVTISFSINQAVDELCNRRILKESLDGYTISHDSMKFLICDYLRSTGEYSQYVYAIADILISETRNTYSKLNSNIYLALTLLEEVNPNRGYTTFVNLLKTNPDMLDAEIYEIGARCFCSDTSNLKIQDISNIIVPQLLPTLFNAAKTQIAKRLSEYIYSYRTTFDKEIYVTYLFFYIQTLVEMSILKSDTADNTATSLFEELMRVKIYDDDILLQIYLLGMSIYEHLLDYNMINSLYQKANNIVEKSNCLSPLSLAKFYRNKGLVFSHKVLVNDYKNAIKFASQIPSGIQNHIITGTSQNNLGLAYFYAGRIKRALVCFNKSVASLECVGCDTTRIYNNIAICYFMLGNYQSAYESISKALSTQIDGYFINLCMETNYALILDSMGDTEYAIKLLDDLIAEYDSNNRRSSDTVPYSAAMLNRAYLHIKEEEYLDAIKLLKKSTSQQYRYEQEAQQKKRQNMINYCLYKENLYIGNSPDITIITGNTTDIYQRPYSLIPFAYYVI